jgi:parvulin-like peptidyl-prolyl isomerase
MVKEFEDAVAAVAPGEVAPVVETPFGFHVIRRDAVLEVHCAQLMIGFAGAERPIPGATRTREQARARIEAALAELDGGGDWATVVAKYGDGALVQDGGDLGWFGRRQLMPVLDEAAFDLDIGARSAILESPAGFHILSRVE